MRSYRHILLGISAITFFSLVSFAGEAVWERSFMNWKAADLLKAASEHQEAEAEIVVLFEETLYQLDDQGRVEQRERMVYRILNESGADSWSVVERQWAPWYQNPPAIRARVTTPQGDVHELDPKTISDTPVGEDSDEMFSDRRLSRAPLPAVGVGAVVEQEIILHENKPFFAAGVTSAYFVGRNVPVRHERVVISYPSDLLLNLQYGLLEIEPQKSELNGRRTVTFDFPATPAMENREPSQRPDIISRPMISFSTGRSWQDVSSVYNEIIEKQIANADLNKLFSNLKIPGKQNVSNTINDLLAVLRSEVRYTGIEFGESSIIPVKPEEALKRKYGDCKDQAALLVAMLRRAGIQSHIALIRTGPKKDVFKELPGIGAFSHAIVYVSGKPEFWIDPTDEFAKAGQLPAEDQGRLALIIGPATTTLVRTPESTFENNRVVERREFHLREEGPAHVLEATEYYGTFDSNHRYEYKGVDQKTQKEWFEDYAKRNYLSEGKVSWKLSELQDISRPFRIEIEMEKATRGFTDDTHSVVAILPSGFLQYFPNTITEDEPKDKKEKKKRKTDYYFSDLFVASWEYKIQAPPGYRVMNLPETTQKEVGGVRFLRNYSATNPLEVKVEFRIETPKRILSPEEYELLRAEVSDIRKENAILIQFEHIGNSLLSAGKIVEALSEIKKLKDLHPNESLHRSQMARALLIAGLGEEARSEAKRATEIGKQSASAHITLGHVLEHDSVGRRFANGFDFAGALSAYTKAIELEPENEEARASRAILFERNKLGARYGTGSDLSAAIKDFEYIEKELEVTRYRDNHLYCLLWSGRFDELRKKASQMDEGNVRDSLMIASIAALEGADKALKEAAALRSDYGERAKLMDAAGSSLVFLRRYPEAATLIESTIPGNQNAVHQKSRVDLIKKLKRHEEMELPANDPRSTVKKLFIGFLSSEGNSESLVPFFSKRVRQKTTGEGVFVMEQFRTTLHMLPTSGVIDIPIEFLIDTIFAMSNFYVDGDAEVGYRVLMQGDALGQSFKLRMYIVPEENELRIVATETLPAHIGFEALRRFEAKDLKGARQWLNWGREEIALPSGDDPCSGNGLHYLWKKGNEVESFIRAAAASLMVLDSDSAAGMKILEEERSKFDTEEGQTAIDIAMLPGYFNLKQNVKVIEITQRLSQKFPRSDRLFNDEAFALLQLGRYQDLQKKCNELLVLDPGNVSAMRYLARAAEFARQYDDAHERYKKIIDTGKANHVDYNEYAWLALFRKEITKDDLEAAQRAVNLAGVAGSGALHTLAVLYAENGSIADALQTIRKSMDLSGKLDPRHFDWYVFGRLAEFYGMPQISKKFYDRVEKPKLDYEQAISMYALAQKRRASIDTK